GNVDRFVRTQRKLGNPLLREGHVDLRLALLVVLPQQPDGQLTGRRGRHSAREIEKLVEALAGDQLVFAGPADRAADGHRQLLERDADDIAVHEVGVVLRIPRQVVEEQVDRGPGAVPVLDADAPLRGRPRDAARPRDDVGGALHRPGRIDAGLGHVLHDVHQERPRLDQAQVEVQPGDVAEAGRLHDLPGLAQRLPDDVNVTDLRNERAALWVDRDAQLEVLAAPEVQLEDVASAADVLVRIERLFERDGRYPGDD